MHFNISSWTCGLCQFSIEEGQEVILGTSSDTTQTQAYSCRSATKACTRSYIRRSSCCPAQLCPQCTTANQAFPFHASCCAVLGFAMEYQKSPELFNIGQALARILPIRGDEHALQMYRRGFCRQTLEKISRSISCSTASENSCGCCGCLVQALLHLPDELLTNFIWPHITSTFFRYVVPIFGEMSDLLVYLRKQSACHYQVSGRKAIFATFFYFGGTSYITSLCNEATAGSILVKPRELKYDYIVVWLNNVGITAIEFLSTDARPAVRPKGEWGCGFAALDGWIHVKSKVDQALNTS